MSSCSTIKTTRKSDKWPVTYIREFDVRGIIFPDTVNIWIKNIPAFLIGRFSPTKDDIILFERIFHGKFRKTARISPEKYSHWVRHYYGFYNDRGEKIIWVVFIQLNRDSRKKWRNGPYFQMPGAWELLGNLETGNLLDFQ
jgi:hypothetical protein